MRTAWPLALTLVGALLACATPRTRSSAPERAPVTWLFFHDAAAGRLFAVHPQDPSNVVELDAGLGRISTPMLVEVGRFEPATGRLTHVHAHAVVYFVEDAAGVRRLRAAPATGRAAPTSRRVSSLELPSASVCKMAVLPDHARPGDSLIVINSDGSGKGSSGRRLQLARLSMDGSEAPLQPDARRGDRIVDVLPTCHEGGATSRLLVVVKPTVGADGVALGEREAAEVPPRLEIVPARAPFVTESRAIDADREALVHAGCQGLWFAVEGRLRFSDGGALRDPGGVVTPISEDTVASDGEHLYFVGGSAIRRVPLDGRGAARTMHPLPVGAEVGPMVVSSRRVLFQMKQDDHRSTWSVPKEGGEAVRLLDGPDDDVVFPYVSAGSVLAKVADRVVAMAEEGGEPVVLASGEATLLLHSGASAPDRIRAMSAATTLVLAEEVALAQGSAIALRSFDPVTRRLGPLLGKLPAGYWQPRMLVTASGSTTLLAARDTGGHDDVFLVDTGVPGSLRQLTRTPGSSEEPVGDVEPSHCASAGMASVWALGGTLLALSRRRRIRSPGAVTATGALVTGGATRLSPDHRIGVRTSSGPDPARRAETHRRSARPGRPPGARC